MSHFQVPTVNITVLPKSSSTLCESSTVDRSDLEECSFEQKEKSNMKAKERVNEGRQKKKTVQNKKKVDTQQQRQ